MIKESFILNSMNLFKGYAMGFKEYTTELISGVQNPLKNLFKKYTPETSSSKNQNNNNNIQNVNTMYNNNNKPKILPRKAIARESLNTLKFSIRMLKNTNTQDTATLKFINEMEQYIIQMEEYINKTDDCNSIQKCKNDIDGQITIVNNKIEQLKNSEHTYIEPINHSALKKKTNENHTYVQIDECDKYNNNYNNNHLIYISDSVQPTAPERKKTNVMKGKFFM